MKWGGRGGLSLGVSCYKCDSLQRCCANSGTRSLRSRTAPTLCWSRTKTHICQGLAAGLPCPYQLKPLMIAIFKNWLFKMAVKSCFSWFMVTINLYPAPDISGSLLIGTWYEPAPEPPWSKMLPTFLVLSLNEFCPYHRILSKKIPVCIRVGRTNLLLMHHDNWKFKTHFSPS